MRRERIALIGAGGFGREVYHHFSYREKSLTDFFDDSPDNEYLPVSEIDIEKYEILVAVGNPEIRQKIVRSLPRDAKFMTFVHPSAILLDEQIQIGQGSIVCAGSILTTNIKIGEHAHINLNTTIGHDCIIGDYFTSTPSVNISGNCKIGDRVYLGTGCTIREKIRIIDDVVVGLNSGIIRDIEESGTYVGCPAKKIK